MFFRSGKAQILGIIMLVVGGVLSMLGWSYADAAKREATAVGVIKQVNCGRGCTYAYVFKFNDVSIEDQSSTCNTALTQQGCKVGAPVLVYYDPEDPTENALEEFRAASRARGFMGIWMISCGLILIGVNFILNKTSKGAEEPDDRDGSERSGESDVLHIAPGE
jgi:hypothetical protein